MLPNVISLDGAIRACETGGQYRLVQFYEHMLQGLAPLEIAASNSELELRRDSWGHQHISLR